MNRTTRTMPTVGDTMTTVPRVIVTHQSITTARRMMKETGVRHLPVTSADGKLVGLLSERDLQDVDGGRAPVESVMAKKPYTVAASSPLNLVARNMAVRKLGSAVVIEGNEIVGIFTTVDALRALADALEGKGPRAQTIVDVQRRPERPRTRRSGREALV